MWPVETLPDVTMLLVPVTLFATAALGAVLFRLLTQRDIGATADRLFVALVALYFVQSLLVSLRWGYRIESLRLPIGLMATIIPACAFVAYRSLSGRRAAWAFGPVAVTWAALLGWQDAVDLLIPLLYLGFGLLILVPVLRDQEAPALTPLGDARQTRRAMGVIGATLIASAATDAFILYDFVHNAGQTSGHLISIVQTGFVIIMGLAAAFGRSSSEEAAAPPRAEPSDQSDHAQVLTRIEDLFASEGLHRSEDLTLRRLSRRLGLPDRRISEAVNRLRGVNLSQFVNEHRIRDACVLLRDTDQSILQIALAVGFASKSNFNREFQRVVGQTPSGWRAGKGAVS
ncbi:MAG: helix-turn-helix transcriptional regulator [Rhodobacteraceae bacterium]|nr:helix-turn-helix transcriptional regulator [Paracoccaceae bacterium]